MHLPASIVAVLTLLSSAAALEPIQRPPTAPVGKGDKLIDFNEAIVSPTLSSETYSGFRWLTAFDDGEFIYKPSSGLVRVNAITSKRTTVMAASKLPKDTSLFDVDPQMRTVIMKGKEFRGKDFDPKTADYHVIDVATGKVSPLVEGQKRDIQGVTLSKNGTMIAFVRNWNVYLRDQVGNIRQVTSDGSRDHAHGLCNWACATDYLVSASFSPDETQLAILSANNKGTLDYQVDFFTQNNDGIPDKPAPKYPYQPKRIYPTAGDASVSKPEIRIVNVKTLQSRQIPIDQFGGENILGGYQWATVDSSRLIYEVLNRVQDRSELVAINTDDMSNKVIRQRVVDDGGWLRSDSIDFNGYVGGIDDGDKEYIVDLAEDDGWAHIYLQSTDGEHRKQLTSGEWEVRSVLAIDSHNQLVYFSATKKHSTESHIYSVDFNTKVVEPIVDDEAPGYWTAAFTPSKKYFVASYSGPNVPYQEVYEVGAGSKPVAVLVDNKSFAAKLDAFNLPNITHYEMQHPDGYTMNVKRVLPPNFDPSKKYPVLLNPYGGPGSQRATKSFTYYSWIPYIASDPELNFIVYTIDNRGTGYKGRKFRNMVVGQLGKAEVEDQIWAAKEIARTTKYVDANHIGFWGWSFGGYLSSKIIEADSGAFTFAMITAPVTDWSWYNSGYTERYMKLPQDNAAGYTARAVANMTGFQNIKGGISLTFGAADDNVHPQHSRVLIDNIVASAKVSPGKFKTFEFTDSDHSIKYNKAPSFHYRFLTERLWDELQRDDAKHQWRSVEAPAAPKPAAGASAESSPNADAVSFGNALYADDVIF